ncbi:condensation domain-containing protein, partial [Kitasatospora sp. NPDC057198]|uniref:condensation domain-containing protein n=1 Tax=Kitasatospora sp. NPDC057198 TaxID=3346046 RepID=UPI0036270B54
MVRPVVRDAGPLPVSFAQQRLWFLDQLEPGSGEYLVRVALRLSGRLDVVALEGALGGLLERHEVLRSSFREVDGRPVQVVEPCAVWPLKRVDLRGVGDAAEAEARVLAREGEEPFDLGSAPLVRALLVTRGPLEHTLLLTMHHIVSDGWSFGVLTRELGELYTAWVEGRAPVLPELPVQYADFALWQRDYLQGPVLEKQLEFWRSRLDGLGVLELPTDRPRPAVRSGRGAVHGFTLPAEAVRAMRQACRREGASAFMVLLAAFQLLLAKYSGQNDITVGTPVANRNRAEIEGLIGFFVNTLVLRGDLTGDPTASEFIKRVREQALDAYAHQDLPFEKLVEELHPERDLSRTPLFQVMFTLQNAAAGTWNLPGVDIEEIPTQTTSAKFDLTLTISEDDDDYTAHLIYSTDLFDPATVERLATHYTNLLTHLATATLTAPDTPIGDLPVLTPEEQHRILTHWNDTT